MEKRRRELSKIGKKGGNEEVNKQGVTYGENEK